MSLDAVSDVSACSERPGSAPPLAPQRRQQQHQHQHHLFPRPVSVGPAPAAVTCAPRGRSVQLGGRAVSWADTYPLHSTFLCPPLRPFTPLFGATNCGVRENATFFVGNVDCEERVQVGLAEVEVDPMDTSSCG